MFPMEGRGVGQGLGTEKLGGCGSGGVGVRAGLADSEGAPPTSSFMKLSYLAARANRLDHVRDRKRTPDSWRGCRVRGLLVLIIDAGVLVLARAVRGDVCGRPAQRTHHISGLPGVVLPLRALVNAVARGPAVRADLLAPRPVQNLDLTELAPANTHTHLR